MLAPYVDELTARLTAEGLSVTADPRNAAPPVVLILPRRATPRTDRLVRVEAAIIIIAPGIGHGDALAHLDGQLDAVWRAIPQRPAAALAVWVSPHTGVELLCYQLDPVTADIDHEDAQEG